MKLTTTDAIEMTYLRALCYGDSGVGKTTSLRTLPRDKTLIALCERGTLPLRDYKFPVVHLETWDDVQMLYVALMGGSKDEQLAKLVEGTTILAIDSLSEIAELCIKNILKIERPALLKERSKDKTDKPAGIYEDLMSQEDWGVYRRKMLTLISAFCHLPRHVIMTALAAWSRDKHSNDTLRLPNLGGKTALDCLAYFDQVFYMKCDATDKDNGRVWQTFNDGDVRAKDSAGVLELYEPPDWMQVFSKIRGKDTK